MRGLVLTVFAAVGAWSTDALGQYGMYGPPEMIDLPPTQTAIRPSQGGPAGTAYPDQWAARPAPNASAYPATYPAAAPAQPLYAEPRYAPAPPPEAPQAAYARPIPAYGFEAPAPMPVAPPVPAPPALPAPNPPVPPPTPAPARSPSDAPSVPELVPQPAPNANLLDQMLREPDSGGAAFGNCGSDKSPLAQAVGNDCGGCAPDGSCAAACDYCPWYASVTGLIMTRDEPNRFWFSADANNNPDQVLNTNDAHLKWSGGGEVRFGRRFCCGTWALEAAYWTLDPFNGQASYHLDTGLNTPIVLDQVWFYNNAADWDMAADLIDGAIEHRIWRRNEFHSVEVNLLRTGMLCDPHHPLDVNWGVGVRWFRFAEELGFAALHDGTWGADPTREAYIVNDLTNDLVGLQFSVDLQYYVRPNWRIFATPRFGVYNNHLDQNFRVYRGDGVVASPQPGSGVAGAYPVRASSDTLSFLTQVDLGVDWRFARNWSAGVGYRVLVATGMGLADNQVPAYLIDLPEVGHIQHNGQLILHGAFANLTYNF